MSAKTTYEAVNSIGTVFHTFSSLDLARDWVRSHARQFPGLVVEEVEVVTYRRRVYRPRVVALVGAAA